MQEIAKNGQSREFEPRSQAARTLLQKVWYQRRELDKLLLSKKIS